MISKRTSSLIVVVFLCLIAGLNTGAASGQSYRSIGEVDFRNFTYQPGICHKEFSDIGIGRSVKVKIAVIFFRNSLCYGNV